MVFNCRLLDPLGCLNVFDLTVFTSQFEDHMVTEVDATSFENLRSKSVEDLENLITLKTDDLTSTQFPFRVQSKFREVMS